MYECMYAYDMYSTWVLSSGVKWEHKGATILQPLRVQPLGLEETCSLVLCENDSAQNMTFDLLTDQNNQHITCEMVI